MPGRTGYGAAATNSGLYGAKAFQDEAGQPQSGDLVHLPLSGKDGKSVGFSYNMLLVTIVLPLINYCIVSAVLSFKLHFTFGALAWLITVLCLGVTIFSYWYIMKRGPDKDLIGKSSTQWHLFICALCLGAWVMGVAVGTYNYNSNMKKFYDMTYLNTAPAVNPSLSSQQYIDTGRFLFEPGAHIDTNMAMGMRIGKTFCVAPIINPKVPKEQRVYDFWAIGTDCCSSLQPQNDFRCGSMGNAYSHAGMRLMETNTRTMYRMAVQEAEASFKISASNPIFVEWMQDPNSLMAAWYENGTWMYWAGVWSFLVLITFIGVTSCLFFSKAMTKSYPCMGTGFVKSQDKPAWMTPEKMEEAFNRSDNGFLSREEISSMIEEDGMGSAKQVTL